MISAAQCRMARAGLRWTAQELADKAKVGRATVQRLEAGDSLPLPAIAIAIRRAFEEAGITFRGEACVCAPGESPEG